MFLYRVALKAWIPHVQFTNAQRPWSLYTASTREDCL